MERFSKQTLDMIFLISDISSKNVEHKQKQRINILHLYKLWIVLVKGILMRRKWIGWYKWHVEKEYIEV